MFYFSLLFQLLIIGTFISFDLTSAMNSKKRPRLDYPDSIMEATLFKKKNSIEWSYLSDFDIDEDMDQINQFFKYNPQLISSNYLNKKLLGCPNFIDLYQETLPGIVNFESRRLIFKFNLLDKININDTFNCQQISFPSYNNYAEFFLVNQAFYLWKINRFKCKNKLSSSHNSYKKTIKSFLNNIRIQNESTIVNISQCLTLSNTHKKIIETSKPLIVLSKGWEKSK